MMIHRLLQNTKGLPQERKVDLCATIPFHTKKNADTSLNRTLVESSCGLLCIQMLLAFYGIETSITNLEKQLSEKEAFTTGGGLIMSKALRLLKTLLPHTIFWNHATPNELARQLVTGHPAVVSIELGGGHIVLVCGVEIENKHAISFSFIDPNGLSTAHTRMDINEWRQIFNKRLIA